MAQMQFPTTHWTLLLQARGTETRAKEALQHLCTAYWYLRGKSDILDPVYARQEFISPVLFVDGHVTVHDFSKALSRDPYYPYEPAKDWVWYKPLMQFTPR